MPKYESRTYQREADSAEIDHQRNRHIDVLGQIDDTTAEAQEAAEDAKATAKKFRDDLTTYHTQEQNLRKNLKAGTIDVVVDVRRQADDEAGKMRFYTADGAEVEQLTRDLTDDEQLELFSKKEAEPKETRTQAEIDFDALADEGDKLRAEKAEGASDADTFDPADLPAYDPPTELGESTAKPVKKSKKPAKA